jgi:hypothetical protein
MMRRMLIFTLPFILTACAHATISSPGRSDDAIRADMNSCDAGSLNLHDRPVINCLSNHGDIITYADGRIPPYTTGNPYDIPLTAPEVQGRKAAATIVLERWQAAARNSAQNANVTAQPGQQTPAATTTVNSYQEPVNNPSTAVAPTPVTDSPAGVTPVGGTSYGLNDLRTILAAYNQNRPKFERLYAGQSFGVDAFILGKKEMDDISLGYFVTFNTSRDPTAVLGPLLFGGVIACIAINDEATIDRVNGWIAADPPPRVRVVGTISDAEGVGLRLSDCAMKGP